MRLTGTKVTPKEVVRVWKEEFPSFHPPQSRFYPPLHGVAPGEVMLINASVQGMPVYTGVMVLYADEESFTVMTAEGLPEAGWNTFSAYEDEDGTTVAQIQSLARASDPIYELGFRMFGSTEQEEDLDSRPHFLGHALRGERAGAAREGLRGYEPAVDAHRQRLAQRWCPFFDLHDGGSAALGAYPTRSLSAARRPRLFTQVHSRGILRSSLRR